MANISKPTEAGPEALKAAPTKTATDLAALKETANLPAGMSPAMSEGINAGLIAGAAAVPVLGTMWLTFKGIETIVTGKNPFAKNESRIA